MSRSEATKSRIVGFSEKIIDAAGAEQLVDLKVEFGPVFEEYMRENKWLATIDMLWGNEQQRNVFKTAYGSVADSVADFNPSAKAKGGTIKPEEVEIKITDTKDLAVAFYRKDFEQSNSLQTVSNRLIDELFVTADILTDIAASTAYVTAGEANTELAPTEQDIDALEMTAANGELVFGYIAQLVEDFKKTAATNVYHRGSKFRNEEINIKVSTKVDELITMFKAGYIDQSGLLNTGMFGERFRNVRIEVMEEMPTTSTDQIVHIMVHTNRAIMGISNPSRHFKYIPEAINQDAYLDEANHVFEYGFAEVFKNEVALIVQTAAPVIPSKAAAKKEAAIAKDIEVAEVKA